METIVNIVGSIYIIAITIYIIKLSRENNYLKSERQAHYESNELREIDTSVKYEEEEDVSSEL